MSLSAKDLCIKIITNPEKYYWIANVPGRFEAALYLWRNHYNELTKKQMDLVNKYLLYTGRFVRVEDLKIVGPINKDSRSYYFSPYLPGCSKK